MWITLYFHFITFILSVIFGYFLRDIEKYFREKFAFNKNDAERNVLRTVRKIDEDKVRRSSSYRKRMDEINRIVREKSKEGKRKANICFIDSCSTDTIIRFDLQNRGFYVYNCEENLSTISW